MRCHITQEPFESPVMRTLPSEDWTVDATFSGFSRANAPRYFESAIGKAFKRKWGTWNMLPVTGCEGVFKLADESARAIGWIFSKGRDWAGILWIGGEGRGCEGIVRGYIDDIVVSLLQTVSAVGRSVGSASQQSWIISQASSESCGASSIFGLPGRIFRSTIYSRNAHGSRWPRGISLVKS